MTKKVNCQENKGIKIGSRSLDVFMKYYDWYITLKIQF